MIKTLGLSAIGLAVTVPSTDTQCYPYASAINTLCTGIETTYATSSALGPGRCSAEATAALSAQPIATVCGIFTYDCLTKYCCGGAAAPSCTYWGPGSKATAQCNSANWLIDYVYMGSSANAANPPASTTTNKCYGHMPGQTITPTPSTGMYCTYSYNTTDATGATVTVTATGVTVNGVCMPAGTAYTPGMPYANYGYVYPMDYYWYNNAMYGQYYDFYGTGYYGYYYPYYGMYGINGIYDNTWYNAGFWGYGVYPMNYWGNYYGYWGMLAGTRYESVEDFETQKAAELAQEHKMLADVRNGDALELTFSPKLKITQISA